MPEPDSPTFPSCTTQNTLPEPDCDNVADGVLTVVERNSGDLVSQRLICQPCVEREIRGWKMQPDGYCWTLIYQSFKGLVEQEEKLMTEPESTPGPWRASQSRAGQSWSVLDEYGRIIAKTFESEANARRMSAALDMEKALEAALADGGLRYSTRPILEAALAKARGE